MFNNLVTLFNYSENENAYYSTVFTGVEFQPNYQTEFTGESTRSKDQALLIINYEVDKLGKTAGGKYFLTPKSWENSPNKARFFTFVSSGYDFFIKGDYSSEKDVSYEQLKNSFDDIFLIHSAKDFEDDLKHWEIVGY